MSSFAPVQFEWRSQTLSARSSAYGIQPIWPSEYASLSVGNRTSTPENRKSASDAMELLNDNMMSVDGGASGDAAGIFDDEPMCMHSVVFVSWQSANSGSQYPVWMLGRPRCVGISLKQIARAPRAALRSTSFTASSTSQSGMMQSGMSTPPESAHQSSIIQSLYARTHSSPSSRSLPSMNVCPQNRGNVGNASEPSTCASARSSTRAFGS